MVNKWKDEEIEILKKYAPYISREEIHLKYLNNHSINSIQNKCSRLNLSRVNKSMIKNYNQEEWNKKDEEFLINNYHLYSRKELANILNRTASAIQNKARRLNLKKESKYYYDKEYFNIIDSEEKAYWLGFIYADGYVEKYSLGIELAYKDINHLKKFNKSINGNLEVKTRERNGCFNGKKYNNANTTQKMCRIRVHCYEMVKDLNKYGVVPNKTYLNLSIPNIDEKYIIPFIRGYFDGDGAVVNEKYKTRLGANITSANINILNQFRTYLYDNYNICSNITTENKDSKEFSTVDIYKLQINGMSNSYRFLNLLYSNANIYLDRKYNTFKTLTEKYNIIERIKNQNLPL